MKLLALSLVVLGFLALAPETQALACHAGVYRSGCVSRYGATIRRHGYYCGQKAEPLSRKIEFGDHGE